MKRFRIFSFLLILLVACNHTKKTTKKVKYTEYHVCHHDVSTGLDTWIWYYVLFSNSRSNNYYYYSSSTQVTSFTSVTWTKTDVVPFDNEDVREATEGEVYAVDANVLAEMEQDLEIQEVSVESTTGTESTESTTPSQSESTPISEPASEPASDPGGSGE